MAATVYTHGLDPRLLNQVCLVEAPFDHNLRKVGVLRGNSARLFWHFSNPDHVSNNNGNKEASSLNSRGQCKTPLIFSRVRDRDTILRYWMICDSMMSQCISPAESLSEKSWVTLSKFKELTLTSSATQKYDNGHVAIFQSI